MFDPKVWGTVGQWASAIGTTSAFSATFYVIRRDARSRREAQARKVSMEVLFRPHDGQLIVNEGTRGALTLTVHNLSDEAIFDVTVALGVPAVTGRRFLPWFSQMRIGNTVLLRERSWRPPVADMIVRTRASRGLENPPPAVFAIILPSTFKTFTFADLPSDFSDSALLFRDNAGNQWYKSPSVRLAYLGRGGSPMSRSM